MNDWPVIGIVLAGITGAYGYILRHSTNIEKHHKIDTDKIVFKDVCKATHEGINVKLNGIEKTMDERHSDTKKDLEEIKQLIRDNSNQPPRVRT